MTMIRPDIYTLTDSILPYDRYLAHTYGRIAES